jgi:starvation-inducible DNA-binding protein
LRLHGTDCYGLSDEFFDTNNLKYKGFKMTSIDIGISEEGRLAIADGLKKLLADSYTLYLQTHNFHWNVTGVNFRELHLMFEEHYTELSSAVDDIAERIRTLDVAAPATYKEFSRLSSIEEVEGVPSSVAMVELLTKGHEQVIKTSRKVLKTAQEFDDESTASLVSDRMRVHEKTAWMLRATKS